MNHIAPSILIGNKSKSLEYFSNLRWQGGRKCPSCDNKKIYLLSNGRMKCSKCLYRFSDFSETYLGRLYIPIEEAAHLLYLFTMSIPAFKAKQYLRVSLKTAHRAYRIFRRSIFDNSNNDSVTFSLPQFTGASFGWPTFKGKFICGLCKRGNNVYIYPANEQSIEKQSPHILTNESIGELINYDGQTAFSWFKVNYGFVCIRKRNLFIRKKIPGDEIVIEQFWNQLKNRLYQFRGIPKEYFPHYLKEAEFRFNHKSDDQFFELSTMVTQPFPKGRRRGLTLP